MLSPSRQLQLPHTVLNAGQHRDNSSDRIDPRQQVEQAFIHEDLLGNADGTVADVLVGAHNPVGGEREAAIGHRLEASHTDNHNDGFEIRRDLCPVVAVDIHFGVDVKVDVGKSIGLERCARLPHRNGVQDVQAPGAQMREVVRAEVVDDSLDLVDGAAVLGLEQTIEA